MIRFVFPEIKMSMELKDDGPGHADSLPRLSASESHVGLIEPSVARRTCASHELMLGPPSEDLMSRHICDFTAVSVHSSSLSPDLVLQFRTVSSLWSRPPHTLAAQLLPSDSAFS